VNPADVGAANRSKFGGEVDNRTEDDDTSSALTALRERRRSPHRRYGVGERLLRAARWPRHARDVDRPL